MKPLRYDLFLAVSSGPQEESLRDQGDRLRVYVAAQGGVVANVFGDKKAASGKYGPRKHFLELVTHYQKHPEKRPTILLATRLDRFGRKATPVQSEIDKLLVMGVRVHTLLEGEQTSDNDLVRYIQTYVGQQDNKVRTDKINESYARRRKLQITTMQNCPWGIIRTGKLSQRNVKLSYDPAIAKAIREIERRFLKGEFVSRIIADLDERFPKSEYPKSLHTHKSITDCLRNKVYVTVGMRTAERQQELAQRLAQIRHRPDHAKTKHAYLFAGVFACAECTISKPADQCLMHGSKSNFGKKGQWLEYVACERPTAKHGRIYFPVAPLYKAFVGYLRALTHDKRLLPLWEQHADDGDSAVEQRSLTSQITKLDKEETELKQLRRKALSLPGSKQIAKALSEIEEDESALQAKRARIAAELASLPSPQHRDANDVKDFLKKTDLAWWFESAVHGLAPIPNADDSGSVAQANRWAKELCKLLGSHPLAQKSARKGEVVVTWPDLDALVTKRPGKAA